MRIDNNTPIAMLTVGQLKEILSNFDKQQPTQENKSKEYVYGLDGIASIFNCSRMTATRIKKSGQIDAAIKQIGRKIIIDVDLALELTGKRKKGRYKS